MVVSYRWMYIQCRSSVFLLHPQLAIWIMSFPLDEFFPHTTLLWICIGAALLPSVSWFMSQMKWYLISWENSPIISFWSHIACRHMTLSIIYSEYSILSVTKFYFIVNQYIMVNPKLKKHFEVLFLSTTLPSQSKDEYLCRFTSPPDTYLISNYTTHVPQQMFFPHPNVHASP